MRTSLIVEMPADTKWDPQVSMEYRPIWGLTDFGPPRWIIARSVPEPYQFMENWTPSHSQ